MIVVVCTAGADRSVALARELKRLMPLEDFQPCGISKWHTARRGTVHASEFLEHWFRNPTWLCLCIETVHQAYVQGYAEALAEEVWYPVPEIHKRIWNVRNMTPERIVKKIKEARR